MKSKNILVISHDKVGKKMAGPGMRYHQIASELSKNFNVTLATFNPEHSGKVSGATYTLTSIKTYDFRSDFNKFDTIIAMSLSPEMIDYAKEKGIKLVFDLYAPVPVEDLIAKVFAGKTMPEEAYNYSGMLRQYSTILSSGDYFLVSNPIQKDFWLGFAIASGATSPVSYTEFPLYDRIGELPMGINLDELKTKHNVKLLSETLPQINDDDFVLLWTGGIWDWFDAVTPIQAVAELVKRGQTSIKLVFLGTRHPNADVPDMDETSKAYAKAKQLGVLNSNVFFLEGWVDYDKRISYLLRGNAAVYAHKPSMEARYSHRTRVLDHFLCKLPSIVTGGDYMGELIAERRYGLTVDPENVSAFSDAIDTLRNDSEAYTTIVNSISKDQHLYTWANSMVNLKSFLNTDSPSRVPVSLPKPDLQSSRDPLTRVLKKIVPRRAKERIKRIISR